MPQRQPVKIQADIPATGTLPVAQKGSIPYDGGQAQDLFKVAIRFRQGQLAISADQLFSRHDAKYYVFRHYIFRHHPLSFTLPKSQP